MKGRGTIALNVFLAVIALAVVLILVAQNSQKAGGSRVTATPWNAPLLATATNTQTATVDGSWYANMPTPQPVLPTATITLTPTRTTTPPTSTPISNFGQTLTVFPTLYFPTAEGTTTSTPQP